MPAPKKYIRGKTKPQIGSEALGSAEYAGVTGFVHIRKLATRSGMSRSETLCGSVIDSGVELLDKPEPEKDLCATCVRIEAGKDPVFDRPSEQGAHREFKGTRAASPNLLPGPHRGQNKRSG